MPKTKKEADLSQKIIKKIRQEKVKMRPRFYFIFGSLLLAIGLVGAVLVAILFLNLAFFRLRIHGPFGFLWLGHFGFRPFLATFPWLPLLIALAGFFGGLALLRRYDIAYKKSFLVIGLVLVALVLAFGFLLDYSGFNERVERFPHFRPFYPSPLPGQDWLMGEIVELKNGKMVILTPEEKKITVLRDEKTRLPFGGDFVLGDKVRVVGRWEDDVFLAQGIIKGKGQMRRVKGIGIPKPPRQF